MRNISDSLFYFSCTFVSPMGPIVYIRWLHFYGARSNINFIEQFGLSRMDHAYTISHQILDPIYSPLQRPKGTKEFTAN
jgi:hypothetical protein